MRNITSSESDTSEVGMTVGRGDHTYMSDISYNLLFFQNDKGICIQ